MTSTWDWSIQIESNLFPLPFTLISHCFITCPFLSWFSSHIHSLLLLFSSGRFVSISNSTHALFALWIGVCIRSRDSISTLPSLPVSPPPPFLPSIMLSILVYYVLSAEELSSNISDSSSSLLFQSMNESFNSTAFYHSSYRGDAIRNSLLLHIGYLPIYFLAATAYRSSLVRVKYRVSPRKYEDKRNSPFQNTIIFSGVIQFLLTLPYTLFLTWFALFVSEVSKLKIQS